MNKRFLLIDDDHDDTELFREALCDIDKEIKCDLESSGKEALDRISSHDLEKPDIIFLDVNMPLMSGWDVLPKLLQFAPYHDIPILMYSTSSRELDIEKAQRNGAVTFFIKPLDYEDLKKSLKIILDHLESKSLDVLAPVFNFHEGV